MIFLMLCVRIQMKTSKLLFCENNKKWTLRKKDEKRSKCATHQDSTHAPLFHLFQVLGADFLKPLLFFF